MKFKIGDVVTNTLDAFKNIYGDKNVWVIDNVSSVKYKGEEIILYECFRKDITNGIKFQFPETELELV